MMVQIRHNFSNVLPAIPVLSPNVFVCESTHAVHLQALLVYLLPGFTGIANSTLCDFRPCSKPQFKLERAACARIAHSLARKVYRPLIFRGALHRAEMSILAESEEGSCSRLGATWKPACCDSSDRSTERQRSRRSDKRSHRPPTLG